MKLYQTLLPSLITALRSASQNMSSPGYGVNLMSCCKEGFDTL